MSIKGWIPQKISNRTVLWAMEVMRRLTNHISRKTILQNYEENLTRLESLPGFAQGELIENQAQWETVRFGCGKHHNMKYSGCEIIAAFNALAALGEAGDARSMAELIGIFEKDGAMRSGEFGVSVGAVCDFFQKKGYGVRMTAAKAAQELEKAGRDADVLIVTAYNDRNDITAQIHTVCVTKNEAGRFAVHNAYCWDGRKYAARDNGGKGYSSVAEAVAAIHGNAAAIAVIGIEKKTYI